MSIEIATIPKGASDRFTIWIDEDQGFNGKEFRDVIEPLGIFKEECVYSSVGPAEVIDAFDTQLGVFWLDQQLDEFAGVSIYSKSNELMDAILAIMLRSGRYHLRE